MGSVIFAQKNVYLVEQTFVLLQNNPFCALASSCYGLIGMKLQINIMTIRKYFLDLDGVHELPIVLLIF